MIITILKNNFDIKDKFQAGSANVGVHLTIAMLSRKTKCVCLIKV